MALDQLARLKKSYQRRAASLLAQAGNSVRGQTMGVVTEEDLRDAAWRIKGLHERGHGWEEAAKIAVP